MCIRDSPSRRRHRSRRAKSRRTSRRGLLLASHSPRAKDCADCGLEDCGLEFATSRFRGF
eukprot:15422688-Alexandrium_andersonii.AAC.1